MADWWTQDAADPAHPELQPAEPAQSGWWAKDKADPGFPASATPAAQPAAKTVAVDSASLPIFDPVSGLSYDPANPSGPMRMLGGYAAGAVSPVAGAAQLAGHGAAALAPETMSPVTKFTDAVSAWLNEDRGPEYNFGRQMGVYTAPALMAPALPAIGAAAGGGLAGAVTRVGAGAAMGAGFSATTPVDNPDQDYWGQKARQVETGAAIGGAFPAAGALGRAALPGASPAVQALRQAGIEPTPGAAIGGAPGVVESLLGRVPIFGAPVQAGRRAAQDQFQQVVARNAEQFERGGINRVLGRVGESLDADTNLGNDAIAEMADKVSQAYRSAVPRAGAPVDPQASREIINAVANAKLTLPADQARLFENFVDSSIRQKMNGTVLPGQAFKDAESDLGANIRGIYGGQNTAAERALAEQYRQLQGSLRDWLERASPTSAADIASANQAYREMLPIQDAAASDATGRFTPHSLLSASRKFGGRVQFARGNAPMQDYAQNGALQQQQLAAAARQALQAPRDAGGHGAGIGMGIIGADLVERLMEHPSTGRMAAIGLAYPALMGAYSNAGRAALNNLFLSQAGRMPLSVTPFAAQYGASNPTALPALLGQ